MAILDLANPSRFLTLAARLLPWLIGLTALAFAAGLSLTHGAPDDYQQGATVKIMFIHVPSAWLAMFSWALMSLAALGTLVWRHPLADVAAKAAAPIGAAFTFMCLVTGMLWGRPMWGAYWVWDARLTSVLVLFLMYLGVIALWRTVEEPSRAARAVAVLTLVGAINLPYNRALTGNPRTFPVMAYFDRIFGPGSNALGFGANRGFNWSSGLDPYPGHGVRDVLVNGVPVLRDGEHTGAKPGRVVRGPGWRG